MYGLFIIIMVIMILIILVVVVIFIIVTVDKKKPSWDIIFPSSVVFPQIISQFLQKEPLSLRL